MNEATRIVSEEAGKLRILRPEQRDAYVRDGFLVIEGLVDTSWLKRLRAVTWLTFFYRMKYKEIFSVITCGKICQKAIF